MPHRVVIGLGNPGPRYAGTRHNVGYDVVERLAHEAGVSFRRGPGASLVADAPEEGLMLVRPTTYMNVSGEAVAAVREATGAEPGALLVVLDDVALPLGALRLRRKGSDGGHNGLASVIAALGTAEVPRLRLGVGAVQMPPPELLAEFVLARFEPQERPAVDRMVARAVEAVRGWAESGIDAAMNVFNTQERDPEEPDR